MGVIGDIASGIGSIFGHNDEEDKIKKALSLEQDQFGGADALDNRNNAMQFVPYQTQNLVPSALTQSNADQTGRNAQTDALARMANIANQGGWDAQSRAAYNQALNDSNANEASNRAALQQGFEQRGLGGSGVQMAAQLANQQGAANRMNQAGLNAAADARSRALGALSQYGQMGGQLNNQDYNQWQNRANAQDAINRFNWQNSQQNSNANANRQMGFGQQQWQNAYNTETGIRDNARNKMADIRLGQGAKENQYDTSMGAGVGKTIQDAGKAAFDMFGGM